MRILDSGTQARRPPNRRDPNHGDSSLLGRAAARAKALACAAVLGGLGVSLAADAGAADPAGPTAQAVPNFAATPAAARESAASDAVANLTGNGIGTATPSSPPIVFERDEDAPLAGYTSGAPFIRSRDSNFILFPNGRVNIDSYFFLNRGDADPNVIADGPNDQRPRHTIFIRRARAEINGTLLKRFDYQIAGEFATIPILFQSTTVSDAWVNANFTPWANIVIGQFDAPFTLENRTVDKYIDFMERSTTVRSFGIPQNKEIGLMISGLAPTRFLHYEVGVFNGDGGQIRNPDSHFDFMGRAYFAPLALLDRASATRWLSEIWIGGSIWYGRRVDVPYDATPLTTNGAVTLLPAVFGNGGYHFQPHGDLLKWALEVNVPIGPLGFRFELVRNERENLGVFRPPGPGETSELNSGRILTGGVVRSGTSFYAQMWYWIIGGPSMLPTPGQEIPPRWIGYRKGKEPTPIGLYVSARYERMILHQEEAQGMIPLDQMARTALGSMTVDTLGVALNFWWTRHLRLSANYFMNYLDGDMPLVSGAEKFPTAGPLMQPTQTFFRKPEHELLFRAAIAL